MISIGAGAWCVSSLAVAENPLGAYIGAGVGESDVRADTRIFSNDGHFDEHHGAWKAVAGIRPISPLGVELEYIDFGNPTTKPTNTSLGAATGAGAKAITIFGLGYLPLPVPFLDLYGKLGIARLHSTSTAIGPIPFCPASFTPCLTPILSQSDWSTNFAYGAGVQGKIGVLAVRAEYERIDASAGNPDILSVGVTWTF
jgi:opacity protein-like surface antigen